MTDHMTHAPPEHTTRRQRVTARVVRGGVARLASRSPQPAAPRPSEDDFHRQDVGTARHGEVLEVRRVEVRGRRPIDLPAWQIRFASTDARDTPLAAVTTVIRPEWNGVGPQPLLSYQAAINSLSDRGAPSYRLRGGNLPDLGFMRTALRRGWAVMTTDFFGPRRSYGLGELSGRTVLDGIAAAFGGDIGIDPDGPIGLWGYSGGADASLWAAEIAASYAPGIELTAVAAGGTPVDPRAVLEAADGGLFSGLGIAVAIGIDRENQETDLESALTTEGRTVFTQAQDMVSEEVFAAFPYRCWSDLLTDGTLDAVPGFPDALERMRHGGHVPTGALYLYHAVRDQLCPFDLTRALVDDLRARGASIDLHRLRVAEHMVGIPLGARRALRFLAQRLESRPDP